MELSTEQLLAVIEKITSSNQQQTQQIVAQLDAPRREAEKKRLLDLAKKKASVAGYFKQQEENKRLKQEACGRRGHIKRNKMPSFGGQVNQDGYVRIMCTQCLKVYPPVLAPNEWRRSGIGFQAPDNEFMQSLTEDRILAWADWTAKNAPVPDSKPKADYNDPGVKALQEAAARL